ncbi:Plasmodium exported protein, unknown function [Plasmodium malariae]|uniref:Uncharacterized protein n=1 Tax=Plasmodium malariae TaxID=5858 RepID=A0A1A8X4A0_PLAMA|nr:Plasmodium exported protein, unknown function [Plasmodium malariae]
MRRLLSTEANVEEERKDETLKKGIYNLLYESNDSFGERINSLEHDEEFLKRFTDLMQREISEQEFKDLIKYTKFQKQHHSHNTQHNLKKIYKNVKHYDNAEKHKNPHISSKKVDSSYESILFQSSSGINHHFFKHKDIDRNLLYSKKKNVKYTLHLSQKKNIPSKKIINIVFSNYVTYFCCTVLVHCAIISGDRLFVLSTITT